MRRLNESTAREASADPRAFRVGRSNATADSELALTLSPYEVVRIDGRD